jgi:sugar lactone lactonase YvrE
MTTTVLLDGLSFPRSPTWRDDRFWFSDLGRHQHVGVALDGTLRIELDAENLPPLPEHRADAIVRLSDGTVVVAETERMRLSAFEFLPDGHLGNRRCWADLMPYLAVPDGIGVDGEDHIWVASPLTGNVLCIEEGGTIIDTITPSQTPIACAVGGPDNRHLVICTVPVPVPEMAIPMRSGRLELATINVGFSLAHRTSRPVRATATSR